MNDALKNIAVQIIVNKTFCSCEGRNGGCETCRNSSIVILKALQEVREMERQACLEIALEWFEREGSAHDCADAISRGIESRKNSI